MREEKTEDGRKRKDKKTGHEEGKNRKEKLKTTEIKNKEAEHSGEKMKEKCEEGRV